MKSISRLFFSLGLIATSYIANAQPKTGDLSYEISLKTPAGDTVSLSSLQGKVVLIDFWASWCGPCRASNHDLSRLYAKYKSKGFEIYGVSMDEDKKDWIKAIKKDRINWIQVNDNGGREAQTAIDWNLYQIPTSYLINKDGIVVAIDPEKKDLEKALKDLLNR